MQGGGKIQLQHPVRPPCTTVSHPTLIRIASPTPSSMPACAGATLLVHRYTVGSKSCGVEARMALKAPAGKTCSRLHPTLMHACLFKTEAYQVGCRYRGAVRGDVKLVQQTHSSHVRCCPLQESDVSAFFVLSPVRQLIISRRLVVLAMVCAGSNTTCGQHKQLPGW